MRRRPLIPQRELFFAGCEGESEFAYVALLNQIAEAHGLHIRIQNERLNPGAGDPLGLVRRAVDVLDRRRRQDTTYRFKAVFLDADVRDSVPDRTRDAMELARQAGVHLIWQAPNHEAVLLRHLDGCQNLRPAGDACLSELRRRWPDYDKAGVTAQRLAVRIGIRQIVQACAVEPDLKLFLRAIGLIDA